MTTRRGFLAGILAAGFAPAAIGSGVLMPVRRIIVPRWNPSIAGLVQPEQEALNRIRRELLETMRGGMPEFNKARPWEARNHHGDTIVFRRPNHYTPREPGRVFNVRLVAE